MSMTTFLGLSFGVFPCLLFGFIMLLSLLICEYIEEYVAKHLCAWKNRRRRGLGNFSRDLPNRRHSQPAQMSFPPRGRDYASIVAGDLRVDEPDGENGSCADSRITSYVPSAPSNALEAPSRNNTLDSFLDDPPPRYEECVLPRSRINNPDTKKAASSETG